MDLTIKPTVFVVEQRNGQMSKYKKHVVQLDIINFVYNETKVYSSPVFKINNEENAVEACIVLLCQKSSFSIHLQCLPQYQEQVRGKLNFTIGSSENELKYDCNMDAKNHGTHGWGGMFQEYSVNMCDYVTGRFRNMLTITCNISLDLSGQTESDPLVLQVSQKQLSKDLGILLSSEELSDVTLKVEGNELKAHKVILSARSPVFNRMFKSDMAETQLNTVEITDIDFEVMQSILEYMYTDKIDVDKNVEELLVAAEKYQLEDLKEKCQEILAQSLTVENAAHIFILSDVHRAEHLKVKVIHFINCNKQEVLATEEMKSLMKQQPLALLAAFFQM